MKTIFILCGLLLVAGVGLFFFLRPRTDHHGNDFRGYPSVDVAPLVDRPAEFLKKDVTLRGTLARQCPSTGCWFYVRDAAGKEVKVEMGETTPKLPQRVGKKVAVEGRLIRFGEGYEFVGTAVEFQ